MDGDYCTGPYICIYRELDQYIKGETFNLSVNRENYKI